MGEAPLAEAVGDWLRRAGLEGWSVDVEPHRSSWSVHLHHPASAGLILDLTTPDRTAAIAQILETLPLHDELRVASAAPTLENPGVVMGVRTLTRAFQWSRTEVNAVARLFQEHGLLTAAEADWLGRRTGRPAESG